MSNRTTRKHLFLLEATASTAGDSIVVADESEAEPPVILAPSGVPARPLLSNRDVPEPALEVPCEVEEITPASLGDFLKIVQHAKPLMRLSEQLEQARHMLERHPYIDRAYRAGLRQGRDLRERSRRGLGWMWEELEELSPRERGYVLHKVRQAIGVGEKR
jgi:hypothetical protein